MDDRVLENRNSHTSSSHESSLEPMLARSADLGKHSVDTHFSKDRKCEICQRTKITRGPVQDDALAESYIVQNFFGDLRTADHKVLSESCES